MKYSSVESSCDGVPYWNIFLLTRACVRYSICLTYKECSSVFLSHLQQLTNDLTSVPWLDLWRSFATVTTDWLAELPSEDRGVDGRMGSEWALGRLAEGVCVSWLRIGTGGWLLWTRWWTFWFWRHGVSMKHDVHVHVHVDGLIRCLWTATTNGPIVHPPGHMWVRIATVEWYKGKAKDSEKNLSQCYFVHHKYHMEWPGWEPRPPRWEASS